LPSASKGGLQASSGELMLKGHILASEDMTG
jgi:hypothetical protein